MEGNKINGKTVTEEDLLGLGYRKYYSDDLDVFYNKDFGPTLGIVFVVTQTFLKLDGDLGLSQVMLNLLNNVYKSSILVQAALSNGSTTDKTI